MTRANDAAREAGMAAGKDLSPLNGNPFPEGTPKWNAWRSGWSAGVDSLGDPHNIPSVGSGPRPPLLDEIERDLFEQEREYLFSHRRRRSDSVPDLCELLEGDYEW